MGRRRKYFTEEERKAAKSKYNKQYSQKNKEKIAKRHADYYQNNKEKKLAYQAEYRQKNKEKIAKHKAEYYQNNKEKLTEKATEYQATPKGRAVNLVGTYRQEDKKYSRGECTLTAEWVIEHIFTKPCHYCGKTDWKELGCDRIDNALPHRPDNVVPCCTDCNKKKQKTPYDEFMKKIGKIKCEEVTIE